nr:YiiX/YebB-like N1pC/P60 family cysteine hydrolase [uncultured Draconibacterium sp.]
MYIFDLDKLMVGDIILTRQNTRISQLVRQVTGSQYSHAILYVGVASIIDSDGLGVQSNNIQRKLIENPNDAVVLRLKDATDTEILMEAETYARRMIGMAYSTNEAKISHLTDELEAKEPNRQFCTRFVAKSYEYAGVNIVNNPNYCTPEDLLQSDKLIKIDDCLRIANEKEIEFANSENPLEKQTEIHNAIFVKARELTGKDVQTFEQINECIVETPEIDSEMSEFVKDSGYLDMMEKDEEINPQHYNAEKMIEYYKAPEVIFEVAMKFATTESHTRERLEMTIAHLIQLDKLYPRDYFKMEIELYRKLIAYSYKRETEAIKVFKHL